MNGQLERAAEFHGHLGPYLVLGMKMGDLARKTLHANPFELRAEIHTESKTPKSCILDGVQFTSGCTLGKRNIELKKDGKIMGVFFKDERKFVVSIREEIIEKIGKTSDIEQYAQKLFEMSNEELFEYDTPEKC